MEHSENRGVTATYDECAHTSIPLFIIRALWYKFLIETHVQHVYYELNSCI